MILLPLTSDAELRYWPFATGGLILLNIVAFFVQHSLPPIYLERFEDPGQMGQLQEMLLELAGEEGIDASLFNEVKLPGYTPYILQYGEGLNPLQWLSSIFLHSDWAHLLGNLIFLWIFGHVVEGVTGPRWFLTLYLGMGIAQCAVEQLMFLGGDGGSLGASSAIYALMMVAAWLSPRDNIQCLLYVIFRVFFVEIPVLIFALLYFLYDCYFSYLQGFAATTPMLHALGGLLGLVVGWTILKFGWIDNDERDLLTMLQDTFGDKRQNKRPTRRAREAEAEAQAAQESRQQQFKVAVESLHRLLQAEKLDAALAQMRVIQQRYPEYRWAEPQLLQAINLAQKTERWKELIYLSEIYLETFQTQSVAVRLVLAAVLVSRESRPRAAVKLLKPLAGEVLTAAQQAKRDKIEASARKLIAAGVLEPGDR
jgi:membrane associated rhomboid family serine protease